MDNYTLFVRDLLFAETKTHYSGDNMAALESLLCTRPELCEHIRYSWESLQREEPPAVQGSSSYDCDISAAPSRPRHDRPYDTRLVKREVCLLARILPFCDIHGVISMGAPCSLITPQPLRDKLERFGVVTLKDFFSKFPTSLHLAGKLSIHFRMAADTHAAAVVLGFGDCFPILPDSLRERGFTDCSDGKLARILSMLSPKRLSDLLNGNLRAFSEFESLSCQTDNSGRYKLDTPLQDISGFRSHVQMLASANIHTLGDFMRADMESPCRTALYNLYLKYRRLI